MRDDPQRNLKWLEQELLASERPTSLDGISHDTADLLAQVDQILEETQEPEPPVFAQKRTRRTRGEQIEQAHVRRQFDEDAAVLTKTRKHLRNEAKQRKKENLNRNIKGLVVLAVLEIIGILCILGWWLQ